MYDHYTAIYHLLLDRMRLHRSSYPLDKQVHGSRQQRRPSTIAESALNQLKLNHSPSTHQQLVKQDETASSAAHSLGYKSEYSITSLAASLPAQSQPSIDHTSSTSAESGLEVDMDTNEPMAHYMNKPPLTRRHTLTGMTGIPGPELMLRNIGGPSIDSGHGMEPHSESHSLESNLDSNDYYALNPAKYNMALRDTANTNMAAIHNAMQSRPVAADNGRQQTRSPINFREGRRASDGLVCQDMVVFKQKLRDSMKAGGMLELRQEHSQLLEDYSDDGSGNRDSIQPTHPEPPAKPALGKRMSLPTNSIDLPPHRLLEIKKSIQLDHQLGRGQEAHDIMHPFGALVSYEPLHAPPMFNNHPCLQRQAHYNSSQRKQPYKQQSALHQQFQQMHLEQSSMNSLGSRSAKHPPVARQPSYKLAQQQPVMPATVFHGADVPALPWDSSAQNSNFLMQVGNNHSLANSSSVNPPTAAARAMCNAIDQSSTALPPTTCHSYTGSFPTNNLYTMPQ